MHQYLRTDTKYKKSRHKVYRKKSRVKAEKVYSTNMIHKDQVNKYHFCFFCGKEIKGKISHHHLKGRDGDLLTNEYFIVDTHNECHVNLYHSSGVDIISNMPWYDGFLSRLHTKDKELYEKEVFKLVKANIITLEQYSFIIKSANTGILWHLKTSPIKH